MRVASGAAAAAAAAAGDPGADPAAVPADTATCCCCCCCGAPAAAGSPMSPLDIDRSRICAAGSDSSSITRAACIATFASSLRYSPNSTGTTPPFSRSSWCSWLVARQASSLRIGGVSRRLPCCSLLTSKRKPPADSRVHRQCRVLVTESSLLCQLTKSG
jgi:hypothetical protein